MNALEDGYVHCMYCEHWTLYTIVYEEASLLYDIVYVVRVPQMEKYEQRKKKHQIQFLLFLQMFL